MNHDDLPSINVEPPHEELRRAMLCGTDSLQDNMFSNMQQSQMSFQHPFGSMIQQSVVSGQQMDTFLPGQMSPLVTDNGAGLMSTESNNPYLSQSLTETDISRLFEGSGHLSPIEYSPISSSSGDIYHDSTSDSSSPWSPAAHSHHSFPSSPTNDLQALQLGEEDPTGSHHRSRSSSYSDGSNFLSDAFGQGRGRSASAASDFGFMSLNSDFSYAALGVDVPNDISVSVAPPSPPPSHFGTPSSLGLELPDYHGGFSSDPSFDAQIISGMTHNRSVSLGDPHSQAAALQQGLFLTVPLQRQPAVHRRTRTQSSIQTNNVFNTGLGGPIPGPSHVRHYSEEQPSRPLLDTDFPFDAHSPSPTHSSPGSPYSTTSEFSNNSDFGGSSPGSLDFSFFNLNSSTPDLSHEAADVLGPDHSLERRHSFGSRPEAGSSTGLVRSHSETLSRSKSRKAKAPRRATSARAAGKYDRIGMGVFKQDHSVTHQDLQSPIAGPSSEASTEEFKATVGSDKIAAASAKRRVHEARFTCDTCSRTFTARHNLVNHQNSHINKRPYTCEYCGQQSTTQAVLTRHQAKSCKKRPQ